MSCLFLFTRRLYNSTTFQGREARRLDLVEGDGERSEATQTDGNSRDEIKLFVLFSIILPLSASSYKRSIELDIVHFCELTETLLTCFSRSVDGRNPSYNTVGPGVNAALIVICTYAIEELICSDYD